MKRDININRNPISSEEILKRKDFEGLYQNFQANAGNISKPNKAFYKTGWFVGGVASIIIIAITTILITNPSKQQQVTHNTQVMPVTDTVINKKPFINPPIKNVDVAYTSYIINANKGGTIKHFTGSEIKIPKLAFANNNQEIVNGDVEIRYREFHDQADIFFSGIPMNYDSAGTRYFFESAGMIEIQAYQNGEKLALAQNKDLVVEMKTSNSDPKFNLYYLNEEDEKWDYIGKDSVVVPTFELDDKKDIAEDGYEVSTAIASTQKESNEITSILPEEELALNDACELKKQAVEEQEQVVKEIKTDIKKIKQTEPVKPKEASKDSYSFDIDVSPTEFPEMKVYKGMIFEAVDQKNFNPEVYDVRWQDIELRKKEDNQYLVHLSKGEESKDILVFPAFEGEDYEKALANFNTQFKNYKTKLNKRKVDEANAEKELAARKKAFEESKAKLIAEAKKRREEAEKKMLAGMTERQKQVYQQRSTINKANIEMRRIFKVTKTGTWNCDSPVKRPKGNRVLAYYTDKNTGKKLNCINMSLVQKNMNAVFPLYNFYDLTFNPKRANVLWGVTANGNIVVAYEDEFEKAKKRNGEKYNFQMEVINPKEKSLKDIKELIKA